MTRRLAGVLAVSAVCGCGGGGEDSKASRPVCRPAAIADIVGGNPSVRPVDGRLRRLGEAYANAVGPDRTFAAGYVDGVSVIVVHNDKPVGEHPRMGPPPEGVPNPFRPLRMGPAQGSIIVDERGGAYAQTPFPPCEHLVLQGPVSDVKRLATRLQAPG